MKLIVDIPEKTYNSVRDNILFAQEIDSDVKWELTSAIVNGIPLKDETMIATLMSLVTDKDYKPKLDGKMTGKEKLIQYCQEHTAEEIYEYIKKLFDYSLSWTDSRAFIIGWLEGESE